MKREDVNTSTGAVIDSFETGVLQQSTENNVVLSQGTLLVGRYRIEKLLGKGGMGEIYLCVDETLGVRRALKAVSSLNEELQQRFKHEVVIMQGLTHQGIVRIYDLFEDSNGRLYYTMEYVEGESLAEYLKREAPLSLQRALELLNKLIEPLGYAHKQGVVHRDLKPSNIMLLPDGRVKLLDFGIAKVLNGTHATLHTGAVGTPYYMAPEQSSGGKGVTVESDIYSLGVLLYEMITGEVPIGRPPSKLKPELSEMIDEVIWKATEKESSKRYHSARQLKEAFEEAISSSMERLQKKAAEEAVREFLEEEYGDREFLEEYGDFAFSSGWSWPMILGILIIVLVALYVVFFRSSEKVSISKSTVSKKQVSSICHRNAKGYKECRRGEDKTWMVYVPAGEFWQGSNSWSNTRPMRRVYLDGYWIDRTEITVANFRKCVKAGRCKREHYNVGAGYCNFGHNDRGQHPMNCVNWYGVKEYCEWAGKSLCTEAQWEKAARGDKDKRKYPWGNESPNCTFAVMKRGKKGWGCGKDRTWEVGSKVKGMSPFGLLDMAGNVWEWVQDCYDKKAYSKLGKRNPVFMHNNRANMSRVLRGASWYNFNPDDFRVAYRTIGYPKRWNYYVGARCCSKIRR